VDNPSAGHSLSARNAWPAGTGSGLLACDSSYSARPSRPDSSGQWLGLGLSSSLTAAGPRRLFTAFPFPVPYSVVLPTIHRFGGVSRPISISNRKGRKVRKGRPNQGNDQEQTKQRTFGLYPNPRFPLRAWRTLRSILFPSMPCAYHYVSNFFPVSLAWELHSLQRGDRGERSPKGPFFTWGERRRLGKGKRQTTNGKRQTANDKQQ